MKNYLSLIVFSFLSFSSFAQELDINEIRNKPFKINISKYTYSGVMLDKSLITFIKLLECSEKDWGIINAKIG